MREQTLCIVCDYCKRKVILWDFYHTMSIFVCLFLRSPTHVYVFMHCKYRHVFNFYGIFYIEMYIMCMFLVCFFNKNTIKWGNVNQGYAQGFKWIYLCSKRTYNKQTNNSVCNVHKLLFNRFHLSLMHFSVSHKDSNYVYATCNFMQLTTCTCILIFLCRQF